MTPPTPSARPASNNTPDRRVDVGAAEVVEGEDEKQQGNFLETVSQKFPDPLIRRIVSA
jgi:uncharacterized protein (DUF736 family)